MRDRLHVTTVARILTVATIAYAPCSLAADAAPWLLYRDANPFVAASGLPFAPPVAAEGWSVEALVDASNTEVAFERGGERLTYDAEIHAARIAVTRAFGPHWLVRATLAELDIGSGFLDGFLEDYHRMFGFSNGDRGRLVTDGHTIRYDDGNVANTVAFDRRLHALSPLLVDLAFRGDASERAEWMAGATVKVPTSHASALVDDRSTDLSLWLALQSTDAQARWPWGARVGLMQRGNTQLLADRANDQVPFADAMIGYRLTPHWDVAAQLQWHAALYDSRVPLLQDAATLALSSAWHADAGWTFRAGLVEDAIPRHAQDVTFFLALSL
ncbi:DUF3187 family protein [Dokdonella sp.]|uniref:DUF3187 family protein n=1 Tax=Dokdonella sp. TaxID=2291710 RepID=UPI003784C636